MPEISPFKTTKRLSSQPHHSAFYYLCDTEQVLCHSSKVEKHCHHSLVHWGIGRRVEKAGDTTSESPAVCGLLLGIPKAAAGATGHRCSDNGYGLPGSSTDGCLPSVLIFSFAEQQFLKNVYSGKLSNSFVLPSFPGSGLAGVSGLCPFLLFLP